MSHMLTIEQGSETVALEVVERGTSVFQYIKTKLASLEITEVAIEGVFSNAVACILSSLGFFFFFFFFVGWAGQRLTLCQNMPSSKTRLNHDSLPYASMTLYPYVQQK